MKGLGGAPAGYVNRRTAPMFAPYTWMLTDTRSSYALRTRWMSPIVGETASTSPR
jgi:hypothetical protein